MQYRPADRIASIHELRQAYESARAEIQAHNAGTNVDRVTLRQSNAEIEAMGQRLADANKTIKKLRASKRELDQATASASWSGAAIICVTILYQTWEVIGFPLASGPGGYKWNAFWQHESVYGVLCWLSTCLFAIMYKSLHK